MFSCIFVSEIVPISQLNIYIMDKDLEIKRLQNYLEGLIRCMYSNLHFDDQDVVSKSMILAYEHVLYYLKTHDLV